MNNDRLRNLMARRMINTGVVISDREQSNEYVGVRITEVEKFGMCWQIVFIDGEACEIKRILPGGKVMTVCCGEERVWERRQQAINFFTLAKAASEGDGDTARYKKILAELNLGKKICTDEEEDAE